MKGWHKESYRHYLASKGIKTSKRMKPREFIIGGKADGMPCSDFPIDQMKKGVKIEMEHTTNPKVAAEIARDHLAENPKYYDHLIAMEKKHGYAYNKYYKMQWETMIKNEFDPDSKSLKKLMDDDNFAVSNAAKKRQAELRSEGFSLSEKAEYADDDVDRISKTIAHEELHKVLDKDVSKEASIGLDYIDTTPSGEEASLIAEKQADKKERASGFVDERPQTHKLGDYSGSEEIDKLYHGAALDALKRMHRNDKPTFLKWSKVVMKNSANDGTIPTRLAVEIVEYDTKHMGEYKDKKNDNKKTSK